MEKSNYKIAIKFFFILLLIIVIIASYCFYRWYVNKQEILVNPFMIYEEEANYGVSSSNYLATQVGMEVLENGGNAIDAAIAISYALAVLQPYGAGIGGGGCMLIYLPDTQEYKFIDYYSSAPVTSETKQSSIGVPGFVRGMEKLANEYGTISISDLIEPAIEYAENGFEVSSDLAKMILRYSSILKNNSNYLLEGELLTEGDILKQPELAETLKTIQSEGSESFYTGSIADIIVQNTYLTYEDLASYVVDEREPVYGTFYDYDVISASAPFGGITLIQMLKMFELTDISNPSENPSEYLEVLNKISNITVSDRISNVADTNFCKIDEVELTSIEYIKELLDSENIEYIDDEEGETTTAFSVIDKAGMVVSCTNTLGTWWGSRTFVNGIFLNAALDNFSDTTTSINAYEPGKKPRTYISPTIVQNEDTIMAIGTPGGNKIVKILSQILLDNIKFGTDIQTAINKNRVLFTNDGVLTMELNTERENFIEITNGTFYKVTKNDNFYFGCVQAIGYSEELGVFGATDTRRSGSVEIE